MRTSNPPNAQRPEGYHRSTGEWTQRSITWTNSNPSLSTAVLMIVPTSAGQSGYIDVDDVYFGTCVAAPTRVRRQRLGVDSNLT